MRAQRLLIVTALVTPASRRLTTWFQLTTVWSFILRSRELAPKRDLRLGEPGCDGCRTGAAQPRRRAELFIAWLDSFAESATASARI
jgi:hypothetical protein